MHYFLVREHDKIETEDLIPCFRGNLADELLRSVFNANPVLSGFIAELHGLRSIARYQFNTPDADALIPDGSKVVGRFSKRILQNKEQIATLLFDNGFYSLNLKGGEILREINVKWVEIDFDLKTNTVFAPGVLDADPGIVPRDEVVVLRKGEVLGVGKAVLNGEEMKRSNNGVAVRLRHRKK